MQASRASPVAIALIIAVYAAPAIAEPTSTISPPTSAGNSREAAPFKKEEARIAEELKRLPSERIYVEGQAEREGRRDPPSTLEQRVAATLNSGNPEVSGGNIRHGMFYAHGVYWAPEPLTFIYYNIVNRLKD